MVSVVRTVVDSAEVGDTLSREEKRRAAIQGRLGSGTGWKFVKTITAEEAGVPLLLCAGTNYAHMKQAVIIEHPIYGQKIVGVGVMKKFTDAIPAIEPKPRKPRKPAPPKAAKETSGDPGVVLEPDSEPVAADVEELDFEAILGIQKEE